MYFFFFLFPGCPTDHTINYPPELFSVSRKQHVAPKPPQIKKKKKKERSAKADAPLALPHNRVLYDVTQGRFPDCWVWAAAVWKVEQTNKQIKALSCSLMWSSLTGYRSKKNFFSKICYKVLINVNVAEVVGVFLGDSFRSIRVTASVSHVLRMNWYLSGLRGGNFIRIKC